MDVWVFEYFEYFFLGMLALLRFASHRLYWCCLLEMLLLLGGGRLGLRLLGLRLGLWNLGLHHFLYGVHQLLCKVRVVLLHPFVYLTHLLFRLNFSVLLVALFPEATSIRQVEETKLLCFGTGLPPWVHVRGGILRVGPGAVTSVFAQALAEEGANLWLTALTLHFVFFILVQNSLRLLVEFLIVR